MLGVLLGPSVGGPESCTVGIIFEGKGAVDGRSFGWVEASRRDGMLDTVTEGPPSDGPVDAFSPGFGVDGSGVGPKEV